MLMYSSVYNTRKSQMYDTSMEAGVGKRSLVWKVLTLDVKWNFLGGWLWQVNGEDCKP